jgi:hypothetical protein
MEYIYIPNVFLKILLTSLTSLFTGYANTHTHTRTMPTDIISLHHIPLRKERRLEMRSVYLL